MANATKKCLFLILSVTPAWGGASGTPIGVSQRRPSASPSFLLESPSGRRTQTQPRASTSQSSWHRTPPGDPVGLGSPGFPSSPQPSHLEPALEKACFFPCRVSWCNSGLADGAGPTYPPPDLPSDAHSPSCSASPTRPGSAPAQARCRRRWRGRVDLWPCGPVAGLGRQARPLLPRVPPGPPQPRLRQLLRPRPPVRRSRCQGNRRSHVTCLRGAAGHVTSEPGGAGCPGVWTHMAFRCKNPRRVHISVPRPPADSSRQRDWRGGGHQGSWKPGHPSLSHPHDGCLVTLGPSDRTMRLCSHPGSVQQVQGRIGSIGPARGS